MAALVPEILFAYLLLFRLLFTKSSFTFFSGYILMERACVRTPAPRDLLSIMHTPQYSCTLMSCPFCSLLSTCLFIPSPVYYQPNI